MVRLAGGIAPTVHLARQPDDLARVLAGDQYALAHRHTVERTPVQVQAQLIKIERRGSLVLRFENRRAVGAADEQVDPALEVDAAIPYRIWLCATGGYICRDSASSYFTGSRKSQTNSQKGESALKKFITVIPLQVQGQLRQYYYQAVGNRRLQMDRTTSFPILTAVNGYVEQGETFRLLAIVADSEDGRRNCAALQNELEELCKAKNCPCPTIDVIAAPSDERVVSHVAVFQKLIDCVEDDDELFACITYGTKPLSQAVLLAVQYAYRIKKNASISCVVYGQIDRSKGRNPESWTAQAYDETALLQLGEVVRVLAERGATDPKAAINTILSL